MSDPQLELWRSLWLAVVAGLIVAMLVYVLA
ncbi:hypothetical protein TAJ_37 [Mycobacterium phage Taj]|uniref:Uncharacterized protein n=3 Tax=Cheoctovirus TaxID=1623281 RepID=E7EJQ5_9CAUD|nr:hypothetical protein PBI_WEE_38 [Mycobacterium phage Wee]YP_009016928.1 hypothetical protein CM05_gp038 [Mycobacterium phage DeadP]YP_009100149.1 hypothetical protein TAJ_37 [Mycobacterium phage Taj]UEM45999.1 hypothetical protein SEA_JALFARM20_41 [Mycobacterium phage JalFarm20]ADU15913.1 hypothetical protein PBI_WEE_38 [Mycobacterium phage Wee]AER47782.1 hypothetical protein DEADP_38 [Mycobacterium phage DeadP]AFO10162.1 hypothetical protein TAJ_37 [Mycobacterium phage Taj]